MVLEPKLDPSLELPLYRQLSAYLREMIGSGALPLGERLPATRELAGHLGINRTTVSAAYELLENEGLLSGQVGRGSFVASSSGWKSPDWLHLLSTGPAPSLPFNPSAAPISFAASRPPHELFPLEQFRLSCEEVLRDRQLASILQLGPAGGYEPLRQFLKTASCSEGVLGPEDDLLITNGCQQALDLLRRVLVRPRMRIAVEDPVYPGLKNVLAESELDTLSDPFNLRGVSIALATPNFQNPTGLSLPRAQRELLLDQVGRNRTVLIENDIYSALRYEGESLPSIKQLAPGAGTVLLRSFSKIAFPGLRLGWVIGPGPLIDALRQAKQHTDLHSDQFSQAVMLRFAESGRLDRHIASTIDVGRQRLRVTLDSLERFFPSDARWTRPEGGFNVWVTLPPRLDAGGLLDRAQRAGVTYLPGSFFSVHAPADRCLRLSFAGCAPEQIRSGIQILGTVFKDEQESRRNAERQPLAALV